MGPAPSELQILLVLQIKVQLRAGALPSKAPNVFLSMAPKPRGQHGETSRKKYVDALSHKPPENFHVFTR
jgi:hypothetical protein